MIRRSTQPRAAALALPAALLAAQLGPGAASASDVAWKTLEPGLQLARIESPRKSTDGDSVITVLRADLKRFRFTLASVKFDGGESRTAGQWAAEKKLVAASNAGLYAKDLRTSVGMLVHGKKVNNPRVTGMGAILAFDRRTKRVPRARLVDRRCENFDRWRRRYRSFLQSARLWDCRGKNLWSQKKGAWSMAVVALDTRNRALLLYTRSPYTVHDFANIIRKLPLGIERAMYLEGGRPSQLYVKAGGTEIELAGAFGSSGGAWAPFPARPIPNVLGLARR